MSGRRVAPAEWRRFDYLKASLARASDPRIYLLTSRELRTVERRIYGSKV